MKSVELTQIDGTFYDETQEETGQYYCVETMTLLFEEAGLDYDDTVRVRLYCEEKPDGLWLCLGHECDWQLVNTDYYQTAEWEGEMDSRHSIDGSLPDHRYALGYKEGKRYNFYLEIVERVNSKKTP